MTSLSFVVGPLAGHSLSSSAHRGRLDSRYHIFKPRFTRSNRGVICSAHEVKGPDGHASSHDSELQDFVQYQAPIDERELQESDRRVMDGITETGVNKIEGLAEEAKTDLEDLQRTFEENASKLIDQETQAVLQQYNQRREELLDKVVKDREIISEELERITELADGYKSKQGPERSSGLREKAYVLASSAFTLSAFIYAWKGFADGDSSSLTNAAIDAIFAAACTYAFSLRKRKV